MGGPAQKDYDCIVIGSGFGGAVSALRLAEKGYSVAVLEKGRRYRTEDFPKTNWNLRKYVWMPKMGLYGIQCLTLLKHVFILHGSGVGGGSLVYANNLLVPPDEVFERPEWGPGDAKARLAPHYQTARRMLGATPAQRLGKGDEVLRQIGSDLTGQDTFHVNEVGIFFGEPGHKVADPYFEGQGPERTGCTFCGACMIGCPVGGKNTLDKNYLYLAEQQGAQIIPETEVTAVRPLQGGGYEIRTRRPIGLLPRRRRYTADKVVFSGGVMGTVKLLLACKGAGHLPDLSPALGDLVRTNSEALLTVTARDSKADYSEQIAITSGIYPDKSTHIEVCHYNRGSNVLGALLAPLTDGGRLPRWMYFAGTVLRHPINFIKSMWIGGWAARTNILLVMQTLDNYLRLDRRRRWWRLGGRSMNSSLPPGEKKVPSYIPVANEVARRMAKEMDGVPMSAWTEVLFNVSSTAHILGGCIMGDDPERSVVGFDGQVHGYPGLYVADGSVVPANLGVNPSLTITALSEYIMSQLPAKGPAAAGEPV